MCDLAVPAHFICHDIEFIEESDMLKQREEKVPTASSLVLKERLCLYVGIFIVSGIVLAFETILPRIFAVFAGSVFMYYAISIALMGLSGGGIFVFCLTHRFPYHRVALHLFICTILFGATVLAAIFLISKIGGSIIESMDQYQMGKMMTQEIIGHLYHQRHILLMISGLILSLPFFFAGICVSLCFKHFTPLINKVYFADLVGAGFGCIFTILCLSFFDISFIFLLFGAISLIGAFCFLMLHRWINPTSNRLSWIAGGMGVVLLVLFLINTQWPLLDIKPSVFAYRRGNHVEPHHELDHKWTPLGRIGLFTQFWSPPGSTQVKMREKVFVGMDSGGHAIVEKFSEESLHRLKHTSKYSDDEIDQTVVPALFDPDRRKFLVLLAGAGLDHLRIYSWFGAEAEIDGVEINKAVVDYGLNYPGYRLKEFFDLPRIRMFVKEGRSFVEKLDEKYDVISISYPGATFASGSGAFTTTPQYVFTKEAFKSYFQKLSPGGVIAGAGILSMKKLPAVVNALREELPARDLRRHFLLYRFKKGGSKSLIIYRNPMSKEEFRRIQLLKEELDLDILYHPFQSPEEQRPSMATNSIHRGLLLEIEGEGKCGYRPRTDDWPFINFNPRIFKLAKGLFGSSDHSEGAQLSRLAVYGLSALILVSAFLTVLYIVIPFVISRRFGALSNGRLLKRRILHCFVIFGCMGAGFIFLEVSAIHKFVLFLEHPTYSFTIVVFSLLLSTGLGSLLSDRFMRHWGFTFRICGLLVILFSCSLLIFFEFVVYRSLTLSLPIKIFIAVIVLFPLGCTLGVFFPQLLRRLDVNGPELIPWAWAINALFTVLGSNLGALLVLFFGGRILIIIGSLLYLPLIFSSFKHFGQIAGNQETA